MHENYAARPHPEYVVLDIGEDLGALIVYTDAAWHGTEIEISPIGEDSKRSHKDVLERGVPPAPRSPPSSTPSPRAPTRCGAAGCPGARRAGRGRRRGRARLDARRGPRLPQRRPLLTGSAAAGAQAQQLDQLRGRGEWIRDDPAVAQGEGGDRALHHEPSRTGSAGAVRLLELGKARNRRAIGARRKAQREAPPEPAGAAWCRRASGGASAPPRLGQFLCRACACRR